MSASLVGSEMCIRDRVYSDGQRSGDILADASWKFNEYMDYDKPSAAAVSYTHLTLPTICSV
eukprot:12530049-Alexandrium_andersonii.AAC.1